MGRIPPDARILRLRVLCVERGGGESLARLLARRLGASVVGERLVVSEAGARRPRLEHLSLRFEPEGGPRLGVELFALAAGRSDAALERRLREGCHVCLLRGRAGGISPARSGGSPSLVLVEGTERDPVSLFFAAVERAARRVARQEGGRPVAPLLPRLLRASLGAERAATSARGAVRIEASLHDAWDWIRLLERERRRGERARRRVERLEEELRRLVHDLAKPLCAARNVVWAARRGGGDPGRWCAAVEEALARIEDHVVSSTGGEEEAVDVGEAVEQVLRTLRPIAQERGVRLRRSGWFPGVRLSRARVVSVLLNLVGNALDHRGARTAAGRVDVIGRRTRRGGFLLGVRDDGPGLPGRTRGAWFERGRRGPAGGAGTGLWLVERALSAIGGRVGCRSRPGVGCLFYAHFPRSSVTPVSAVEASVSPATPPLPALATTAGSPWRRRSS